MVRDARALTKAHGMKEVLTLHFAGASDAFRTAVWPAIREELVKSATGPVPVELNGALQIAESVPEGGALIPWTPSGYDRFLVLANASDLKVGELVAVCRRWWDRTFPRALLVRPEPESPPVASDGSKSAVVDAVRAAESAQLAEIAQTSEGYALLLSQLETLAEIEDPVTIAKRFGNKGITDFTSEYTTQESEGRSDREPSQVWTTEEYVAEIQNRIREILGETEEAQTDPQNAEGLLVVPDVLRGGPEEGYYVLREDGFEESADLAGVSRHYVKPRGEVTLDADALIGVENIEHPENKGPPLRWGDFLYTVGPDLDTETIEKAWATYQALARSVRGAPTALEQARKALVYARVLVQAPKCQGEAKKTALEFLRGAFSYYRRARERVGEGAGGSAYANLRRVAGYLAREAVNLAESCAAGQTALVAPAEIDINNISEATLDEDEANEAAFGADEEFYDDVDDDTQTTEH